MLSKAHLTSYSRISGSRWVITPSWLYESWRYFLYSPSVYSCHFFLISSGLRDTACLRACIGLFEGGHHYLHYLHYSSGQITGRKHISALQQKNWIKDLMSMAPPMRTRPSFPVNLSHHRGLECKTRSQEIPGVTGKFGLGIQNKAGQRLTKFWKENSLVIENTLF